MTELDPTKTPSARQTDWDDRERLDWRRRLGRLRLGAEPVPEQVDRYRRVTWALTAVPLTIGLMFVALFAAFERPLLGTVIAGMLVVPVAGLAWLDFALLRRRATAYEKERREYLGPEEDR
jgi:hypothetical protein